MTATDTHAQWAEKLFVPHDKNVLKSAVFARGVCIFLQAIAICL